MIDDNMLKSIEKVSILRQLPNLEQLEIANNLMGDSDFYREELFDRIPQLKIIDCKDKDGNVAIDSESESEDEENSMIALGRNGEKKGGRNKSV
jgi:acidic leucine-rich nuclear phosphoprotein 32 family protein B